MTINSTVRGGALAVISLLALATVVLANGGAVNGTPTSTAGGEVSTDGASASPSASASASAAADDDDDAD
ncbi:MAG TPA: hypothetical protein VI277_03195, partial [Candidatus Limnocylindria bacterium]